MDRALAICINLKAQLSKLLKWLMPLTSLLTISVVTYLTYVYLWAYIPLLHLLAKIRVLGYWDFFITARIIVYLFFPLMIFWTLAAIVFGNPGVIDKAFVSKLYRENGVEEERIGEEYTMKEVIEMLTENYLVR